MSRVWLCTYEMRTVRVDSRSFVQEFICQFDRVDDCDGLSHNFDICNVPLRRIIK